MRTLETLIDEAVNVCGSGAAVGRRIGASTQEVSDWRKGRRTISPITTGLICDVLNLRPDEAQRLVALAVIASAPPEKAGVLRRVFFVCTRAGGATCIALTTLWTGESTATVEKADQQVVNTIYIVRIMLGAFRGALRLLTTVCARTTAGELRPLSTGYRR